MPRPRDWLLVPLYVVIAAIGMFWGGRNTYRSLANRSPLSISCARYAAETPADDWVRLDGCTANLDHMGIETLQHTTNRGMTITDAEVVYIPLHAVNAPTDPAKLVLRVDHGALLRVSSQYATDADFRAAQEELAHPLEGLVERALDRSERTRTKIRELGFHLADDFVVVDYRATPRPLALALGVLGLGLAALALLVRKWRRRRRPVVIPTAKLV